LIIQVYNPRLKGSYVGGLGCLLSPVPRPRPRILPFPERGILTLGLHHGPIALLVAFILLGIRPSLSTLPLGIVGGLGSPLPGPLVVLERGP